MSGASGERERGAHKDTKTRREEKRGEVREDGTGWGGEGWRMLGASGERERGAHEDAKTRREEKRGR